MDLVYILCTGLMGIRQALEITMSLSPQWCDTMRKS